VRGSRTRGTPLADAHDSILEQRSWLERLAQRMPGFRGYYDRENRREADRELRGFGVTRLDSLIAHLHDQIKSTPLRGMQKARELITELEGVRNRLRFADQGYAGFFSEIKWDSPELLDAVYRQDEQIVESVVALSDNIESGAIEADALQQDLRALERALVDRRSSILELLDDPDGE